MSVEETVVIDQQNQLRLRAGKVIMVAIGLALVGAVCTTFAYLTYAGNQTPNRFTVSERMTCDMIEPAWTNAALTDNGVESLSNPTVPEDTTKVKYYDSVEKRGVPAASQLQVPGTYYAKNPFVINTSTNRSDAERDTKEKLEDRGFAGLKVQFQKVNAEGKYVNMDNTEVEKLLKCYYIGSKATTANSSATSPSSETTKDTLAGFGNGSSDNTNSSVLGSDWYQLVGSSGTTDYGVTEKGKANSTGAMYFVNNKRLDSLALASDFSEDATSSTWGYVTGTNPEGADYCYASSPLFQTVRFVDGATKTQMDELRDVLDPKNEDGKRIVSEVKKLQPGWRMVISAAMIQAENASDSVLDSSSNLKTDSVWFLNFKTALDATEATNDSTSSSTGKPTYSTGVRLNSQLGAYITKTDEGATITSGTGVPEPTNIG